MAGDKDLEIDSVIKNPTRVAPVVRSKYEPEYVRLNKDPVNKQSDMYASIDDIPFDENGEVVNVQNGHIIDNNDFVNFGTPTIPLATKSNEKQSPDPPSSPEVGDYILMVLGKLITSGSLDNIEARVKSIIYGEDPSFKGLEVGLDDIVVLKRVALKIGVFVDD